MKYLVLLFFVVGCVSTSDQTQNFPRFKSFEPKSGQLKFAQDVASGYDGAVAAAHPLATEAGIQMLKQGGHAVDAAVASSLVISVVRPQSTGIGGGGFLLLHLMDKKQDLAFDFRERAPQKAHAKMFLGQDGKPLKPKYQNVDVTEPSVVGHLSVAVPGLIKGLLEIHKTYGKLPLETVMAPAIKIAEEGFDIYPVLADAILKREKWLRLYPGSRKIYFSEKNEPLKVGQRLVQKDLGSTLKEILKTEGRSFYEGSLAKKITDEMASGGGLLSMSDLRRYRMIERIPVSGNFRGRRIVSMPPPSSGGIHLIEMLNMLDSKDLSQSHPRGGTYLHFLSEVMRRAFADRSSFMGDPDFITIPTAKLTSKSHALKQLQTFDPDKATDSKKLAESVASKESDSTTHISVVDRWGNGVSTTQTVNFLFGSCVVVDGTGIMLNDEMDDFTTVPNAPNAFGLITGAKNEIMPNKTPLSSMTPTFVLAPKTSKLEYVLGSPGGPRIINGVLQTIVNGLVFGFSLKEAVHATRIHHQYLPDVLYAEEGSLDPDAKEKLQSLGHRMEPIANIGDVQAIRIFEDGRLEAVSDVRGDGQAKVVRSATGS